MNKEEFEQRFKEDKFFENYDERYTYCFEAVSYYLKHIVVEINGIANFINVMPAKTSEQKRLFILAFQLLKNKHGYNKKNTKPDQVNDS